MQVEFSAQYVADDELKMLSLSTLNSSAADGFESTSLPAYKLITEPSTDISGVSHFELEVSRTLIRQVDTMRVFSIVRGHPLSSMKKELISSLSLRDDPAIEMNPSWWPWLPLIPFNISVEVK